MQEDGPVVQHIKKNDDKIVLSFKDKASRDKAKTLLSKGNILSKGEDGTDHEVFTSVFAPRKSYPAIVRFHDLDGVEIFKGQNLTKERSDQQTALINALENSNPALKGKFHSVRLLYNHPNTKSFLARIALFSKLLRDDLVESGRILLGNRSHAMVEVDPSKEVRQCTRCFKFGHLVSFCKVKFEECGKSSNTHTTASCTATPAEIKCRNYSFPHLATSPKCPALAKAVEQFIKNNSTDKTLNACYHNANKQSLATLIAFKSTFGTLAWRRFTSPNC